MEQADNVARACVIGDPISHSRSPLIHGHWLERLGISGAYDRRRVAVGEVAAFLQEVRAGRLRGGNVTVPNKEEAARHVDALTETARRLGAVNTVWEDNGKVWGDNTDVTGFLANLDERSPGWDRKPEKAIVLGAGGAARAIIYGLQTRGFREIGIANRSLSRAREIAGELQSPGERQLVPIDWEARSGALEGATFLVNTTSLGMTGQPPLDISLDALPIGAVVHDIVYAPLETDLLRAARQRGNPVVDGLGMLLHQAAPGFARWFGQKPQVTDELRQLIINDVNRSAA
ncbi:shikimate dehydrogenase [Camelimonas sp. ID_303_24]